MRSMKTLATAACFALSAFATADAQARPFRDSWFWGIQTGAMSYASSDPLSPTVPGASSFAPLVGADWLITRKTGGLDVSFAQAFMATTSTVLNGPSSADTGYRAVDVKNLRRFNLAAMAFPGDYLRWHPYVGAGFSFGYLGAAEPLFNGTDTQKQVDYAASAVNDVKAAIGPMFILGAQYRLKGISAFGQFTVSTMSKDFLLANGHTISMSSEFGFRYNLGSSIER